MADGRCRDQWTHTSNLMALIANAHRDPKQRPYRASDFNPYAKKKNEAVLINKDNIGLLRDAFLSSKYQVQSTKCLGEKPGPGPRT